MDDGRLVMWRHGRRIREVVHAMPAVLAAAVEPLLYIIYSQQNIKPSPKC